MELVQLLFITKLLVHGLTIQDYEHFIFYHPQVKELVFLHIMNLFMNDYLLLVIKLEFQHSYE